MLPPSSSRLLKSLLASAAGDERPLIYGSPSFSKECFMLVLTRKCDEKIRIGDNVTVTVFRIKGKAVTLGIDAPVNIKVIRGELAFDPEPKSFIGSGTNASHGTIQDRARLPI
jgi:carbon storage regulator